MLGSLASLSVLSVGPALADTSISEHGRTGPHKLVDTVDKPGAICEYNNRAPEGAEYYQGLLKHLHVRPPKMRARYDGVQDVGWRFMVLRTIRDGSPASWKTTYTSPLQTATATKTRNARFSYMSINVIVPRNGRDGTVQYAYRINVEMNWYGVHGSSSYVSAGSTHEIDHYAGDLNGRTGGSEGIVYGVECRSFVN
jgi:hypothetical protein